MKIGGLQKTTLLDYPNKIACIVFTIGCNFRCGYCYNSELVTETDKATIITEEDFFQFLRKKRKILDAVVITGGEPTLHKDLPEFIKKIKNLNYLVKLDTNGTHPVMLKKLIKQKLIDYIAMDIKAPLSKYVKVVNVKVDNKKIRSSINLIMNSGLAYEFRSTILPSLHSEEDIATMAKLVKGADKYFLQKFRAGKSHINPSFSRKKSFTDKKIKELAKICKKYVGSCQVR